MIIKRGSKPILRAFESIIGEFRKQEVLMKMSQLLKEPAVIPVTSLYSSATVGAAVVETGAAIGLLASTAAAIEVASLAAAAMTCPFTPW